MNEQEIIKAKYDLKATIVDVLREFGEKHDSPDSIPIVQAVLSETVTETERALGKMAPFTSTQIEHICYQMGHWYLIMKPLLEEQNNLGCMKEKLKTMICGE